MTKQSAISLEIPILPDRVDALTSLLSQAGNPQAPGSSFPFDRIDSLHFARFVIAPKATLTDGTKVAASLIYAANVDGSLDDHLRKLVEVLPTELDEVLSHCSGYSSGGNAAATLSYLQKCRISTPGFYVGAPNRTVQQIRKEAQLHWDIRDFVKRNEGRWSSTGESYAEIQEFLADPKFDWAREKYHLPRIAWLKAIPLVIVILILAPLVGVLVVLIHFLYERRSKPFGLNVNQVSEEHLSAMMSEEDWVYQNQLSQVFETKSGLWRLNLKFFLWAANLAAKWVFVGGQLLGTPTIHFARWVMIDGGRRFVFFSNFDGSYDMYLGDFVDNGGWGLNAIYGASVGYPRTKFVFGGGSYNIGEFMGWGRHTQVQTQTWYSAYPWLGLQQIVDRTKLRAALFNSGSLSEEAMKEALRRI